MPENARAYAIQMIKNQMIKNKINNNKPFPFQGNKSNLTEI